MGGEEIFFLKLHENIEINTGGDDAIIITKVIGGYIYRFWNVETRYYSITGTFVPTPKYFST